MTALRFRLDGTPVGTNNLYATGRGGRRFATSRGRAWKDAVAWAAVAASMGRRRPLFPAGLEVSVRIVVVVADRRRRDLDGAAKPILDALTGVAYADDSQVSRLVMERRRGDRAGVEVEVEELRQEVAHVA